MVSLMAVNNEIGSKQDINKIGKYLKEKNICFMVDGVQAIGKMDINMEYISFLSMSMHKLYGLKGSGILIKKNNLDILPLISGGQQEFNLRAGTTNAPADIVAYKTIKLIYENGENNYKIVERLRNHLIDELKMMDGVVINTPLNNSIPHIINFSFPELNSEILLNAFDKYGICVSAQSSCSSKTKKPSKTISAMGKNDKIASSSIRISLSHHHNIEDVDNLLNIIKEVLNEYKVSL